MLKCNNKIEELELLFPTIEYKSQVEDYLQEFINNGEEKIPGCGGLDRIKNFEQWLEKIKEDVNVNNKEKVPASLFLTIRKSDKRIVGNVQIRHLLNEKLLKYGGHIGDSVRPSERRKRICYRTNKISFIKMQRIWNRKCINGLR